MAHALHRPPARCPLCHRPLPEGQDCDAPACQTRRRVAEGWAIAAARSKAQLQAERQARARAEPVIRQIKRRLRGLGPGPVAAVVAPFLDAPLDPLPDDRRTAFVGHLDATLESAFATAPDDNVTDELGPYRATLTEFAPALDVTCMSCRGLCCKEGNRRNAWISPEMMQVQRLMHPGETRADLRAFYLAHLPARSVRDSCVFHGGAGCTLPRDRRSAVCNAYQCGARRTLAQEFARPGTRRAVSVALCADHHTHPEAGAPGMRAASFDPHHGLRPQDGLALPALPAPD